MTASEYYTSLIEGKGNMSLKKIKVEPHYTELLDRTNFLPEDVTYFERVYCLVNGVTARPTCQRDGCDNFVNFPHNLAYAEREYRMYCSTKCQNNCPRVKAKKVETTMENFGVENPSMCEAIKRKKYETITANYGGFGMHAHSEEWWNRDGRMYILKVTGADEEFYKVGVTSRTVKDRYPKSCDLQRNYTYTVEKEIEGPMWEMVKMEQYLIENGEKHFPKHAFAGVSECIKSLPKL